MSGLMTSLLLTSVGITNWHITESSERVAGRIRTEYLNGSKPDDSQYQEIGLTRFPVSIKYADTNETLDIQDHKLVFQLSDVLNEMNVNSSNLALKGTGCPMAAFPQRRSLLPTLMCYRQLSMPLTRSALSWARASSIS